MPANLFYGPLRVLLGDRLVHGLWNYSDDVLHAAMSAVFFLNLAPPGFALDGQFNINPVPSGDAAAWIAYQAALLTIGGEEGGYILRTKVVYIRDYGERKRDLLADLRMRLYQVRDGDAAFTTLQSFVAFLANMPAGGDNNPLGPILEFSSVNLRTGIQDLAI